MKKILTICFAIFCFSVSILAQVPTNILVNIVKAEDERRYDKTLEDLMKNPGEKIRARAALAAGRVGDERAVPTLANLLENDTDAVRPTAAFALGETESVKAADAILKVLKVPTISPELRARLTEAAGKIAAVNAKDPKAIELGDAILDVLDAEARKPKQDRLTVLLGLTAILRAKPEEGNFIAANFLTNIDPRIRADAANTLSRIHAKNANEQLRAMLLADRDAIVRANAARSLGAAEDKNAFDLLLEAAISDEDSRVRVSAIRSLGNLKDKRAADKLLERGEMLLADYKKSKLTLPNEKSELLEIATTLGRILPNSNDEKAIQLLQSFREADKASSPEIEIAYAKIAPIKYVRLGAFSKGANLKWQELSSQAQALGELAVSDLLDKSQKDALQSVWKITLTSEKTIAPDIVIPDYLRTYAQFKPNDLPEVLIKYLRHKDVFIRATAAELLGDTTPSKENVSALKNAFGQAILLQELMPDKEYNDAQLAIITALAKQDKEKQEIKVLFQEALQVPDFLIRRHTANVIKQYGLEKESPATKGVSYANTVMPRKSQKSTKLGQILNNNADYTRAVSRKNARAILTTDKGTFTIEFTPEDAPLTVDNFIKLAKANYFNGLAIHRVVPNFVMQDGDPRGDGNGGPGFSIRCEMNMVEYERGAVGMALSGKDTGGSQWFVTHSPQPHLDGGYTVFGRVNETDMKVVDNLVRGDKILNVKIVEGNAVTPNITNKRKVKTKR